MVDRIKYNIKILNKLEDFLLAHPGMRFIQALWALKIVNDEDRFYEEPSITFEKLEAELEFMEG